jgi:hypothetical protein
MSLNLLFAVKGTGDGYVDFPFQTPTNLTHAVFNEQDNDKRLALIEAELFAWEWEEDEILTMLNRIKGLLNNPALSLTYI